MPRLPRLLKDLLFGRKAPAVAAAAPVETRKSELPGLCAQLLQNKELVALGKIQLIGLEEIRKRLGKRWPGLNKIVYAVVEDTLKRLLGDKDISLRHNEYAYLIVFADLTGDGAVAKIAEIGEDIRRQLFAKTLEELKQQEIDSAEGDIGFAMLGNLKMATGLMQNFAELEAFMAAPIRQNAAGDARAQTTLVSALGHRAETTTSRNQALPQASGAALPLDYVAVWEPDTDRLSHYLAVPPATGAAAPLDIFDLDCAVLAEVARQLARVRPEQAGMRLICPVHYQTLYDYDSYERYKKILLGFTPLVRGNLELIITGEPSDSQQRQKYWFVKPLKGFCGNIIALVPFEKNIAFQSFANAGLTAIAVRVRNDILTEEEIIRCINGFTIRAKALRFPQVYVMDINTLSLTTSSVCAGVNLLSGPGIHSPLLNAGHNDKYSHRELLDYLAQ